MMMITGSSGTYLSPEKASALVERFTREAAEEGDDCTYHIVPRGAYAVIELRDESGFVGYL